MRTHRDPFILILTMLMCTIGIARADTRFDKYECLIEPAQTVEIRSAVVGLLEKVYVRRGDKVRRGQVIVSLVSDAERAAVDLARYKSQITGPITSAFSKAEFAKRKYQRRKDMYADKLMAGQEKDDAEGELKLAESELLLAKENKQLARIELQQQSSLLHLRTIRSPFEGIVVDQKLYAGEVVEPSADKKYILKLAQVHPLKVHVIMPFAKFDKVKLGMMVEIMPESPLNKQYTGRVIMLDRIIDAASGTFGLFVSLPNPTFDIPAGIKCRAHFPALTK